MNPISITIIAIISIYYTYENLRLLYAFYKEKLDIPLARYYHLGSEVSSTYICSIGGLILVAVGVFQDSYLVVLLSIITIVSANIGFKRGVQRQRERDDLQEELDFYDRQLNDPQVDEDMKETVRSMKGRTLKIQREERKIRMKGG